MYLKSRTSGAWKAGFAAAAILLTVVAAGCVKTVKPAVPKISPKPREFTVSAAANLQEPLNKIASAFRASTGNKPDFNFGASGLLARQIEQGAPADLFVSAGSKFVNELASRNLIDNGNTMVLAYGRLVLVFGAKAKGRTLADLTDPKIERIAVANPETAPFGAAAKEALTRADLWSKIQSKIVYGGDISQTLQFVESGNADAALVSLSQVKNTRYRYVAVDAKLYSPLKQVVTLVKNGPERQTAMQFYRFLTEPKTRQILIGYGYGVPTGAAIKEWK